MRPLHRFFSAFLTLGSAIVATNCDNAPAKSPNELHTTSAVMMRPDENQGATHTVDSAGFVDNGGRTSDEVGRTEMSGMRATEIGGQQPTGTPGTGLPLPFDAPPPKKSLGASATPEREVNGGRSNQPGVTGPALAETLTRTECERDAACLAAKQPHDWPTASDCMNGMKDRAQEMAAVCANGYESNAVNTCLAAVRAGTCKVHITSAIDIPACTPAKMCLPRGQ